MTRTDPFLDRLESYLDEYEGLTPLPEPIRDEVRAALPKTKQLRPLAGPSRFHTMMNGNARYAVAAAVVALAAIIGFGIYRTQVGPAPNASPTPSADATGALLPADLVHLFTGRGAATGKYANGEAAIHFNATNMRLELDNNRQYTFTSDASLVGDHRIQFVSKNSFDCNKGDVGTYSYELSPGGNVLTLTAESDDCADRQASLSGQWLRSACKPSNGYCLGSLEAGSYSSILVDPRSDPGPGGYHAFFGAITYTVPDGWANFLDDGLNYGLTTQTEWDAYDGSDCFDCPGTRDLVEVLVGPGAAMTDCTEANVPGVGFGIDDLTTWLTSHPGLDTTEVQDLTINGRAAKSFTITARSDWTGTCPEDETTSFVAVPVFYHQDSWHWALNTGASYGVVLIDLGDGHAVAVMIDSADEGNLDAFIANAMPIIQTFDFPQP